MWKRISRSHSTSTIVWMWLWMRSHKWVSSVWEEWLALFARYYFFSMTADYMYWQSQGKHGLCARANKGWEGGSVFELFVAVHQSTSVSDSNFSVCFQQMCEADIQIFTRNVLWHFEQMLSTLLYRKDHKSSQSFSNKKFIHCSQVSLTFIMGINSAVEQGLPLWRLPEVFSGFSSHSL